MKRYLNVFLLGIITVYLTSCASSGSLNGITARGTLGRLEIDPLVPLYTGNGGSDIRLAILAPEIHGDVPAYLPVHVQGLLNNIFNRYSAINLIDRQNLDRIISEQNIAASGSFSDRDFITIGNLTNTQNFLFGTIQRLSSGRYSLQLSITDSATGIRRATFMMEGSLAQFEGRGILINEAAVDLLAQMGVNLTEAGKQSLLAGNSSMVRAEFEMARGITALTGGDELGALFNITQAITFDPSNLEALSRLNTLSTNISGGTISQRIVTDIQARDRWLEVFRETALFFNNHPPFEIIFDPNLIQIGETDFAKRTVTLGMRIAIDASEAGFNALNALLEGLEKTGRRDAWGFSGWPLMDISPRERETVVFNGRRSFSYKVDVRLINENGKVLGNSSITLNTEQIRFNAGDKHLTVPSSVDDIVRFTNVKAENLTPTLTILIVAVNGISSDNLSASGYMRIETGDLEKKAQEQERRERLAQEQREQENRLAQDQREREQRQRAADRQREREEIKEVGFWGYNYALNMPIGATLGLFSFYGSFNIGIEWKNRSDSSYIYEIHKDYEKTGELEWIIGYSIPLSRYFRIPVGIGAHHIVLENWEQDISWEHNFSMEAGLTLVIFDFLYASSTYRFRLPEATNGFTIGVGFFRY